MSKATVQYLDLQTCTIRKQAVRLCGPQEGCAPHFMYSQWEQWLREDKAEGRTGVEGEQWWKNFFLKSKTGSKLRTSLTARKGSLHNVHSAEFQKLLWHDHFMIPILPFPNRSIYCSFPVPVLSLYIEWVGLLGVVTKQQLLAFKVRRLLDHEEIHPGHLEKTAIQILVWVP